MAPVYAATRLYCTDINTATRGAHIQERSFVSFAHRRVAASRSNYVRGRGWHTDEIHYQMVFVAYNNMAVTLVPYFVVVAEQ